MKLTGQQYQQLTDALLDAFPTLARLRQMVRFRLGKNLDAIAMGDSLKDIVFTLIGAAEAEGWIAELIAGARESNPGNPTLLVFSQQFGLATATPSGQALERVIKETNSFLDVTEWRTKLGQIENRVCRIEITLSGGKYRTRGTGFLLGSDVVITNYHVMAPVIECKQRQVVGKGLWAKPSDVVLRFDYKRLADGTTLNPGAEYHLAEEGWLIDQSPMSPVDDLPKPQSGLPQPDHLDYALLRVKGAPGSEPVGQNPEPEAPIRGWVELPTEAYDFQPGTPLLIMQHPEGQPLKLAFDTDAIIGLNDNRTRITYKTNTERGSSGSPCFNINWELVALHHAGDPNFAKEHKPTYNQGIPFTAIMDLLEQRGLSGKLGEQKP